MKMLCVLACVVEELVLPFVQISNLSVGSTAVPSPPPPQNSSLLLIRIFQLLPLLHQADQIIKIEIINRLMKTIKIHITPMIQVYQLNQISSSRLS
jgi:hypothetical protein